MLIDDDLRLTKTSVGPMDNNAYLLVDSGQGLLVDAASDPLALLAPCAWAASGWR